MKNLGGFLLSGIALFSLGNIQAQSLEETALLFSRTTNGGSARVMGMGGTQVSLGGDFSSASSNPAGLGRFNRSEVSISPGFFLQNNISKYFGDSINTSKSRLAIPSLGIVIHNKKGDDALIRGTFAFTLTRLNDFNATKTYKGYNPNNSITDYFAIDSDGTTPNNLPDLNYLAFDTYLIDSLYIAQDNFLYYIAPVGINFNDPTDVPDVLQRETIKTSGAQNQWSLAYGANLNDMFYFGAGLNVRTINYKSNKVYTESDFYFSKSPSYNPLNILTLEENLALTGTGLSGTLGFIFRPADFIQVGLSYITPTTYSMKDTYSASITSDWSNFDYYGDNSTILNGTYSSSTDDLYNGPIRSKYNLKTPGKLTGGATFFFGKVGLASLELETTNYAGAQYRSQVSGIDYNDENSQIGNLYKSAINLRMGGEFRLNIFRFRAGLGYQSNPYQTKPDNISRALTNLSVGAGIRKQKFYADVALSFTMGKNSYNPYTLPNDYSPTPFVKQTNTSTGLMFTVGYNF